MTATRAENYGDIGELGYERFIAQLYLDAQRLKTINPAESVRLLNRIVYEQGLSGYLNGLVIADLQEAYRNYGDALSGQGDHCAAEGQYTAALDLRPALSKMSLGALAAQRDSAAQACSGAPTAHPSAAASPRCWRTIRPAPSTYPCTRRADRLSRFLAAIYSSGSGSANSTPVNSYPS